MKKIIDSYDIKDYEILTDDGFVDVVSLHQTIPYKVFELTLYNGYKIKCADTHVFFNKNFNEIFLNQLNVGDVIKTDEGDIIVKSIVDLGYDEIMYDFELSNKSKRRYYTNGILSHNTELAKALAEFLFNDENAMIRLDMSEYQDKSSASKLIGSAPGYVGYEEGGQLTELVKRKPYSVVLLDEIEKSHPDVFNTLLQVFDDGRLTDNKGNVVNFKNTIIIMTSNLGSSIIQSNMEGMTDETRNDVIIKTEKEVIEMLRRSIRPELLNRIDEIIVFHPLSKDEILSIVRLQFESIKKMVKKNGLILSATEEALKAIAEWGYDPQFGARPVKRVIQEKVINVLSSLILNDKVKSDNEIVIDLKDKELVFINK
jgi:hypothetical protein